MQIHGNGMYRYCCFHKYWPGWCSSEMNCKTGIAVSLTVEQDMLYNELKDSWPPQLIPHVHITVLPRCHPIGFELSYLTLISHQFWLCRFIALLGSAIWLIMGKGCGGEEKEWIWMDVLNNQMLELLAVLLTLPHQQDCPQFTVYFIGA